MAILRKDKIYQYGTANSLTSGIYEGTFPLSSVLSMGDFGLGTFAGLNGEMVVLDGVAYQMKVHGVVQIPKNNDLLPYATVNFFDPKSRTEYNHSWDYSRLDDFVGRYLISKNIFYAIKITGLFSKITFRNVALQKKPYPLFSKVEENEKVDQKENIQGTLVGYWTPLFSKEIIGEGFHFHFISKNKKIGGHVHDFKLVNSIVEIMPIYDLQLQLSDQSDYLNAELLEDYS